MNKIYLFTSKKCVDCPAVKAALKEKNIDYIEVDIESAKFDKMQYDLLSNNIFIMTTPRIIVEENGKMSLVELAEIV
jgi:glutaredoxin